MSFSLDVHTGKAGMGIQLRSSRWEEKLSGKTVKYLSVSLCNAGPLQSHYLGCLRDETVIKIHHSDELLKTFVC